MQRLVRVPDHRPERSSAWHEVDAGALHLRPARPDARHGDPGRGDSVGAARLAQGGQITRPVWLIEPPQPLPELGSQPLLDGAPLQLLSGPERIETGWWDQGLAGRDYFIAQTADASLVWVYRLRLPDLGQSALQPRTQLSAPAVQRRLDDHGWYLHGRFG